jgi:DNA invertase Pin-like site-specific DNA recombinase
MRVALYLRVSTVDQNTERQARDLRAVAAARGWDVVEEYNDHGISGAKGRDKRPAFDRLLKDAARRRFDLIAAWSVDRLGRSLQDLVGFLGELQAVGCNLYLHQQALDTTTPSGRAMFQMCGVFAEFERAMIVERVRSGLAKVRAKGTRSGKPIGRPRIPQARLQQIRADYAEGGTSMRKLAQKHRISLGTVQACLADAT